MDRILVARRCGLAFAALFGSLIAVLADLIQKDVASATLRMSTMAHQHLALDASPVFWMLFLIVLGLGICFVQEPGTKQGAFWAGASVVALLMTVVPFKEQPSRPVANASPSGSSGVLLASADDQILLAQKSYIDEWAPKGTSLLRLHLTAPGATPDTIARITLSRVTPGGDVESWRQSLPVRSEGMVLSIPPEGLERTSTIRVTVEVPGYEIASATTTVAADARVDLEMRLDQTGKPLWLQRAIRRPSSSTPPSPSR